MPTKDLHEEPFDESTIAKLEIFEDYAQAWIPTFATPVICIFDFFAGRGYDVNGVAGSPIRILDKIREQIVHISAKDVSIKVYLNEFEPDKRDQRKFQLLKTACDEYLETHLAIKQFIEIKYSNEDFESLFPKLVDEIKKYPSLVYIDQNGVKFLSEKYLLDLEKTGQTDFLYFVSTSYFWRLGETEEFKKHINIDMTEAKKDSYKLIHKSVVDQLRRKLPTNTKLKLYPFSLKKGANIYGIIFGASHPRAVDKFLAIAWKRNATNGEANFDIDDDANKNQLEMFSGQKLTKIEAFKNKMRLKVLEGDIQNNFDALQFVYDEGHIGSHAAECLKEMKKNGEITFEGISPLVTYENVHKKSKRVDYKTLKK